MDVDRAADGTFRRGEEAQFTDEVWLRSTLTVPDGTGVGVVHFSPGCENALAPASGRSVPVGVTGRGRVRTRGEVGHALEPGDVVYVGPDEWHFHGGGPDTPMVHVAVNGSGAPEWGEPVTDEEYAEGF
jgi:quercetin dioxygenase-like cupin family protein